MWVRVVCLLVLSCHALALADDALLESLYGVHGGNEVTLCMRSEPPAPATCRGALLGPRVLVTRASCVAGRAMHAVRLCKTIERISYDLWIQEILERYPSVRLPYVYQSTITSPEQMFIMAVVLPSVSFILFFIFITAGFKNKITKNLEEEKESMPTPV